MTHLYRLVLIGIAAAWLPSGCTPSPATPEPIATGEVRFALEPDYYEKARILARLEQLEEVTVLIGRELPSEYPPHLEYPKGFEAPRVWEHLVAADTKKELQDLVARHAELFSEQEREAVYVRVPKELDRVCYRSGPGVEVGQRSPCSVTWFLSLVQTDVSFPEDFAFELTIGWMSRDDSLLLVLDEAEADWLYPVSKEIVGDSIAVLLGDERVTGFELRSELVSGLVQTEHETEVPVEEARADFATLAQVLSDGELLAPLPRMFRVCGGIRSTRQWPARRCNDSW